MAAPIDLKLLRAFVCVHEAGSFSVAAQRLGVPRSTVSRAVAALETATGVLLFHRTTRSVTTTAAGAALHERVAPSLAVLDASVADLPEAVEVPSGTLRLTTSVDLGATLLAEAVARFVARYPHTRVEVHLGRAVVDLARDGFDLALRFAPGPLRDSSMVARKIGPVVFQLFAAPTYLGRRGAPRSLADLPDHDCVAITGTKATPRLDPRISCDDKLFVRELLRAGAGIGLLPSYLADADLAAGTLQRVLPRWEQRHGTVYLVQPGRKHVPRRVTAFRELLLEMFRQRPLSP